MRRDQTSPVAFVNRRRGYSSAPDAAPVPSPQQKDFDVEFTTKYIDTLNDLQRLEDENKRLMLRMRSLEAQIVPASKNSQHAYIKMVAPSCLEYHQEERKLNRALQDENGIHNKRINEALNKIKLLELELIGKVDEARQGTQSQYTSEIKKLQESLVELERRWGIEKKQLVMERDSYALQCESLKVDASLVRSQLTEMTKMSNKETITELTERLEAAERDNADLREQLSELNDDKEKHDSINNTNNISTKLNEPFQPEDFHFPQKFVDQSMSREYLLSQPLERMESSRPSSSTRAPSPSPLRVSPAPSRPSSSRNLLSRDGDIEGKNREMAQIMARLNDATTTISKLENDTSLLSSKNKEYARVAEQNKAIAEQLETQNEELTAEVKRLSDKIRLLTTLDRFSRPESPPMLPVMLSRSSPLSSSSPSILKNSPATTARLHSSLEKSRPSKVKLPKERSASPIPLLSPTPSPWSTTGPFISGQKIISPKKSTK